MQWDSFFVECTSETVETVIDEIEELSEFSVVANKEPEILGGQVLLYDQTSMLVVSNLCPIL